MDQAKFTKINQSNYSYRKIKPLPKLRENQKNFKKREKIDERN